MDVMSIANASTAMKQSQVSSVVETKMLRNSMDIQAQIAQGLLQALPQNQPALNPPGVGGNFDAKF